MFVTKIINHADVDTKLCNINYSELAVNINTSGYVIPVKLQIVLDRVSGRITSQFFDRLSINSWRTLKITINFESALALTSNMLSAL